MRPRSAGFSAAIALREKGEAANPLVPKAVPAQRSPSPGERGALAAGYVRAAPQVSNIDRYNRRFYERCWQAASLLVMPGVRPPANAAGLRVEVGCGLRPRLPLAEALFVDVSPTACAKLRRAGAQAICASIEALPFASGTIEQLYMFDILEHISDDIAVGRELARVCAADGWLVLSTPLHAHRWHEFDRVVGHARRYEPRALVDLLGGAGFTLEGFARFGMRLRSPLLTRIGAYCMVHWPETAFRYQERLLRLTQRGAQPLQLQRACVDDFLVKMADAEGAVTAWRHRGA